LVTIVLYYELYTVGGVAPLLTEKLHMSFTFLVVMIGVTNLLGAFGSLAAGLADRVGRVNLIIWGMLLVGLLTGFVVPAIDNRWGLAVALCVIGFIEGVLLVATPALVRDFSPQVGRAAAMGVWNLGPVAGSLIVAIVATTTLAHFNDSWTSQFRISGIVGLVMFVIALFTLKELSPRLRDQVTVDKNDLALNEARATSGFEVDLDKPFRQLFKLDIIGTAIGFAGLLLLYFTLVGFAPVLYATAFHLNTSQANGVAAWAWAANVIVTMSIGLLFDWSKVRKPWMIIGGVLTIIFELILLLNMGNSLSFAELSAITAFMSGSFGFAAVAFYAGFTETVEQRNPALVATGLAIWGWIIRIIAFLSFVVIPHVVTSATTLLEGHTNTPQFKTALAHIDGEWQTWLWVCIGGVVVFLITVPLHSGLWSSKKAKALIREHDRRVEEELAAMRESR
jgi:MFS family permease